MRYLEIVSDLFNVDPSYHLALRKPQNKENSNAADRLRPRQIRMV